MKLKLIDKKTEARDTKSFFWKPESAFTYLPGQFFYWTIPQLVYPDSKGNTRHFSLSSSPTEGNLIRFTTRMRKDSGYKKTLDALPYGETVEGEGPDGEFIFDETEKGPHVFLAGGIGITPFRSMIKYVADKDLDIPIRLIYSNTNLEDFAFKDELFKLGKDSSGFKVDFIITSKAGRVNAPLINKLTNQLVNPTYWVAGPPGFTHAMKETLGEMNISSGKVRTEDFTGY